MNFIEINKKYKGTKDKFESLFMFIVHDLNLSEFLEKVKHQMTLLKLVKDGLKRKYLSTRMYKLRTHIEDIKDDSKVFNSVFFLYDDIVDEILLKKQNTDLLKYYDANKYIFKYGNNFDLEYLENLLTNNEHTNVLHLNNNTLTYYYLNYTKKKIIFKEDHKGIDLSDFLLEKKITDKTIIHGSSVFLKNYKSDKNMIFNKTLDDEEIITIWKKDTYKKYQLECEEILSNLTNPKYENKIVFGKDINKKINERLLSKLYCTTDMYSKVKTVLPPELLTFDIYEVKSFEKNDIGDKLRNDFGNGIGLLYY